MSVSAMRKFSYGLYVITARSGGKDNGCISNSAIQSASDPCSIVLCLNKKNYTHDLIKESGMFNISFISQDADFDLFKRFGFQSGRDADKFDGFEESVSRAANGLLYVKKFTNAYACVSVDGTVDLGSHTLFYGRVTAEEVLSDVPSVTYDYYGESIKPKPAAPAKTESAKTVWRCTICGYEYEGDELPADFVCPLCKHPASDFEKVSG